MDQLDPYTLRRVLHQLDSINQLKFCQVFSRIDLCSQVDSEDFEESGLLRFFPTLRIRITETALIIPDKFGEASLLPPFSLNDQHFKQVLGSEFLTFDGEVFFINHQIQWNVHYSNINAEIFDTEERYRKNIKYLRENAYYIERNGKVSIAGYYSPIPFPVMDKVLSYGTIFGESNIHYFSKFGQVYGEILGTIRGQPVPPELLNSSPIIRAFRIAQDYDTLEENELIFLQSNGNLIWTSLAHPENVQAVDFSKEWVDLICISKRLLVGLTTSGQLYQLFREANTINRKLFGIPEKIGPIAKFIVTGANRIIIDRFGQGYRYVAGINSWDIIAPNALLFDFSISDHQSYAIGTLLDNFFEDSEQGEIVDIQRMTTDLYDNILINYQLRLPNSKVLDRWAWVNFNGENLNGENLNRENLKPRALTADFLEYTSENSFEILSLINSAVRIGKIDDGLKNRNESFYLVMPDNRVYQLLAREENGQIVPVQ